MVSSVHGLAGTGTAGIIMSSWWYDARCFPIFVQLLQVKSTKASIYVLAKPCKWYQASMGSLALVPQVQKCLALVRCQVFPLTFVYLLQVQSTSVSIYIVAKPCRLHKASMGSLGPNLRGMQNGSGFGKHRFAVSSLQERDLRHPRWLLESQLWWSCHVPD